jgi:hypothetical protein
MDININHQLSIDYSHKLISRSLSDEIAFTKHDVEKNYR